MVDRYHETSVGKTVSTTEPPVRIRALMRPCAQCQYENADHLAYCFQCGRRLGSHQRRVGGTGAALSSSMPVSTGGSLAIAPTMMNRATEPTMVATPQGSTAAPAAAPLLARAAGNVRYL